MKLDFLKKYAVDGIHYDRKAEFTKLIDKDKNLNAIANSDDLNESEVHQLLEKTMTKIKTNPSDVSNDRVITNLILNHKKRLGYKGHRMIIDPGIHYPIHMLVMNEQHLSDDIKDRIIDSDNSDIIHKLVKYQDELSGSHYDKIFVHHKKEGDPDNHPHSILTTMVKNRIDLPKHVVHKLIDHSVNMLTPKGQFFLHPEHIDKIAANSWNNYKQLGDLHDFLENRSYRIDLEHDVATKVKVMKQMKVISGLDTHI